MDIALNPSLDVVSLSRDFAARGRLRINSILTSHAAMQVLQALAADLPWNLVYRDGDQVAELDEAQARSLDSQQQAEMMQRIYSIAVRQFQFFYYSYQLDDANLAKIRPDSMTHECIAFLRSKSFVDFVEKVTGEQALQRVSSQASCYRSGHFLLPHDDGVGDTGRKIAYVLNLSKNWKPGWGGLLQFHDANGNVIEAFLPAFNSLSLFRIPAVHSVSCVMPFAIEPRIAISGWLYT